VSDADVVGAQIEYYRARANEYDQYYDRTGPFDLGPEGNAAWNAEIAEVDAWLTSLELGTSVLDVAAGTGRWTERLSRPGRRVVAVDAAPEMLELSRARNAGAGVEFVITDLFTFRPAERFRTVFFGFWLSHVPSERFDEFWELVDSWLAPGGEVLFVDNVTSSAPWIQDRLSDELITRRLNDGRTFTIVKTHWRPETLAPRLERLGWTAELRTTSTYFIYGRATRR
jgi:2-polyprenyl-3-methyl-5-hydroxy-6-metoxy-1,4-benzoquinol methylase